MAKLIEGSIEWNVQQVKHCIDWALDPSYFGFPNDAASHTMDLYCDRINAQTKLANNWDWNYMHFNWMLSAGLNPAQIESIEFFPSDFAQRRYMY